MRSLALLCVAFAGLAAISPNVLEAGLCAWDQASQASERAAAAWAAAPPDCKNAIIFGGNTCLGYKLILFSPGFGPLALGWGGGLVGFLIRVRPFSTDWTDWLVDSTLQCEPIVKVAQEQHQVYSKCHPGMVRWTLLWVWRQMRTDGSCCRGCGTKTSQRCNFLRRQRVSHDGAHLKSCWAREWCRGMQTSGSFERRWRGSFESCSRL